MGSISRENVVFGMMEATRTVSPPKACALFSSRLSSMLLVSRRHGSDWPRA